jgi:nucleoside-diphosphate-sugar epimerase
MSGPDLGPRVAITGAMGFVASRLSPQLRERGRTVVAIVRPGRDVSALASLGIESREVDLTRPETARGAFDDIDTVIHLSGMAQAAGLLPEWERARVRRGVFVSSAGVYTKLKSSGADSKRASEAALRRSSMAFTILRPSMIYGTPADRNLVRLLRWIDRIPVVPVPGGGHTPQQPVHVDDLTQAILASLDRAASEGREYDVGGPEAIPLRDLIHACARALGRPVAILPIPLQWAHGVVVQARRLGLPIPVRGEQILRLEESKAVDIGPARRDLGFEPRTFDDGIREEVRLLRRASPTPSS